MDKWVKRLASIDAGDEVLARGDRFVYTNTKGEKIRFRKDIIILEHLDRTIELSLQEIEDVRVMKDWKHDPSSRVMILVTSDRDYEFCVDTTNDGFLDVVTVAKQLKRLAVSSRFLPSA